MIPRRADLTDSEITVMMAARMAKYRAVGWTMNKILKCRTFRVSDYDKFSVAAACMVASGHVVMPRRR